MDIHVLFAFGLIDLALGLIAFSGNQVSQTRRPARSRHHSFS